MTRPVDDRADAEHDAWLRAALRHAPDAELGAPPALSAAILREAGAARAVAARPSSVWQPLWDAWSWLACPPVAAGFASVMVATVVGLMWWDRPLEEALPRPADARVADARVMAPVGAAPASIPGASLAIAPPPAVIAEAAPVAEKAKAAAPKPQARPPAPALRSEARARAADAAAPAQATRAAQNERAEQAPAAPVAEPEAARKMAAPAPAADAATAPPPAMEAARPAQGAAALTRPAAASATARSAARSSFAVLRADILAQPLRWTWLLETGSGTGTAHAMTPALQAWLARVDEAVAGAALSQQAATEGNGAVLQLLRDGRPHTRLSLGDTGLWLVPAEAGRAPLSAALSAKTAAALKAALDDALR